MRQICGLHSSGMRGDHIRAADDGNEVLQVELIERTVDAGRAEAVDTAWTRPEPAGPQRPAPHGGKHACLLTRASSLLPRGKKKARACHSF